MLVCLPGLLEKVCRQSDLTGISVLPSGQGQPGGCPGVCGTPSPVFFRGTDEQEGIGALKTCK